MMGSKRLGANVVLFNKRNRWLINVVMVIAAVAFLGIAIAPAAQVFRQSNTPTTTPSRGAKANLEDQARGYELVLQREPDNQTALRALVDTRTQLGDIKGVVAPLEKLAKLNADQPQYMVLLAEAKSQSGDSEGAAQTYRDALSQHPGDVYTLQGFVKLQLRQNRPEAAIGLLQDTLRSADETNKAKPNSVDVNSVRLLLAQVYAEQRRFPEALTVYDEAIKNDKQDFRPLLGKAMVLQDQGKDEEAKPLFTAAAALAPAQFKDQISQIAAGQTPTATGQPPATAGQPSTAQPSTGQSTAPAAGADNKTEATPSSAAPKPAAAP